MGKRGFAPAAVLVLLLMVAGLGLAVTRVTDLKNVFQKPKAAELGKCSVSLSSSVINPGQSVTVTGTGVKYISRTDSGEIPILGKEVYTDEQKHRYYLFNGSSLSGLVEGTYKIWCTVGNWDQQDKCSGNPFCNYNGGTVTKDCAGWKACSGQDHADLTVGVTPASSLEVRVFPEEIDQLEKYVITAKNSDGSPYSGNLQANYWVCPPTASTHSDSGCSGPNSASFNIPSNGKAVQDLATYAHGGSPIAVGKYFTVWKPASGNSNWSNETTVSVTPLDLKRYYNLTPGNVYRYNAINYKRKSDDPANAANYEIQDASRLDLTPINFCGEDLISMDFSKTSVYAYFDPYYADKSDHKGTDFMSWRGNFNSDGNLIFTSWSVHAPHPLPTNLSSKPQFNFQDLKMNVYQMEFNLNNQKVPRSQYYYGSEFLDLNQINHAHPYITGEVRLGGVLKNAGEQESDYYRRFCSTGLTVSHDSYFRTLPIAEFYAQNIQTPGYTGPAVSLNIKEVYTGPYNTTPTCTKKEDFPAKCPAALREDWFLAKDIGLVRMDQKLFGNMYGVPSLKCADDPDCNNATAMKSPFLKQEITSYNVVSSAEKYLKVTNLAGSKKRFMIHLNKNDFSDSNDLSSLRQIQLVLDNDANWDNDYGERVMIHVKDNNGWKNGNLANGTYYVYEPSRGGRYGWVEKNINEEYDQKSLGFKISIAGILYDGNDLYVAVDLENYGSYQIANKNIYFYLENDNGQLGIVPKFASGTESYSGYTFAKIPQLPLKSLLPNQLNVPSASSLTTTSHGAVGSIPTNGNNGKIYSGER